MKNVLIRLFPKTIAAIRQDANDEFCENIIYKGLQGVYVGDDAVYQIVASTHEPTPRNKRV